MHSFYRINLVLTIAAGLVGVALAQNAVQKAAPFRELFLELDANQDRAIEAEEVPASARPAFQTLLKRGDRNHNGKLEADEYRELLLELRDFAALARKEAAGRFHEMDKDHDGKLSRDEFRGPPARFDQLDKNGDGSLTEAEFLTPTPAKADPKAAQKKAAEVVARLLERFKELDKDGDGKLARDEFPGPAAQFDRLDVDRDGSLSRDELKRIGDAVKKKTG